MSQTPHSVCSWCDKPLICGRTGIGTFCNSACRKQFQRHPGHTKNSWAVARRDERQRRANAVFKARNRDKSFALDNRYEGPESDAGIDIAPTQ